MGGTAEKTGALEENVVIIRQEEFKDHPAVYAVIKSAFAGAAHADGNEQDLASALRQSDAYLPELSLVAEVGGKIVGHILFTKVAIGGSIQLALAPLSVLPEYQRQGIGSALIREGHRQARELGYGYTIVLGSEMYYSRMGYVPAKSFGIASPFAVADENFMAYKLREDAPAISGVVQYAQEFGIP